MKTLSIAAGFGSSGGTRSYFKQLVTYFADNYKKFDISKIYIFLTQDQNDAEIQSLLSCSTLFQPVVLPRIYQFTIISRVFNKLGLLNWYEFIFEKLTVNKILKYKPDAMIYSIGGPTKYNYALTKKIPSLFISHTLMNSDPIKQKFRRKVYNNIVKYCNPKSRICSVSETGKLQYQKYMPQNADSKLYTVITNHSGYITDVITKKKHDQITILTLGLLCGFKNPDLWLTVAKKISDKLIKEKKELPLFIWAGEGNFYERLKKEAESYDNIRFIGFQSDTFSLYAAADIYVQPSTTENCSLSVIDAMKFGLPCVVSNVGGLPEQVINGYNGFLCSYDSAEEFINSITKLIDNKRLRTSYGKNSRKIFEEKYCQELWNKNFSRLLADILN